MASPALCAEFSCSVCQEVFKDPVLLFCSHSFCKSCLQRCWEEKGSQECPLCRTQSSTANPPSNLVLKNLCEAFLKGDGWGAASSRTEVLCSHHGEKRKLFCLEDEEPICAECHASKRHKDHNCCPIQEASVNRKTKLWPELCRLKKKRKDFEMRKEVWAETMLHITFQTQLTEKQIRREFKELHEFLGEEEKRRIAELRAEEQQKSQEMKVKIKEMDREINRLKDTITAINTVWEADYVSFLENFKETMERAQVTVADPEEIPLGSLIDEAKHLGNLKFTVWKKMNDKGLVPYTPVILDPNTAFKDIILSRDLTGVIDGSAYSQKKPMNPERINFSHLAGAVLGAEGYDPESWTNIWDVEVRDCDGWCIGVLTQSVREKSGQGFQDGGSWSLWNDKTTPNPDEPAHPWLRLREFHDDQNALVFQRELTADEKPHTVRVSLSRDEGDLVFIDLETKKILHSFTIPSDVTVYPFLSNEMDPLGKLRILPLTVKVEVD